jgi:hypothetical protein
MSANHVLSSDRQNLLYGDRDVPAFEAGVSGNGISRKCRLRSLHIKSLLTDMNAEMDENEVYALLCSIASRCDHRRIVVVDPQLSFSQSLTGADKPYINYRDPDNYFGTLENYEIILIPIFTGHYIQAEGHQLGMYQGHWMLLIHQRNDRTTFYEPLGNSAYLSSVRQQILFLLGELDSDLKSVHLPIISSRAGVHHNKQFDSVSCGFFLVLYGESYLFNNGCTFLEDFDISTERKRLSQHLAELFFTNDACYIRRPVKSSIVQGLYFILYQLSELGFFYF